MATATLDRCCIEPLGSNSAASLGRELSLEWLIGAPRTHRVSLQFEAIFIAAGEVCGTEVTLPCDGKNMCDVDVSAR